MKNSKNQDEKVGKKKANITTNIITNTILLNEWSNIYTSKRWEKNRFLHTKEGINEAGLPKMIRLTTNAK